MLSIHMSITYYETMNLTSLKAIQPLNPNAPPPRGKHSVQSFITIKKTENINFSKQHLMTVFHYNLTHQTHLMITIRNSKHD